MKQLCVTASTLGGEVFAPPSKSHSLRAILFASLASGVSRIDNLLDSPDVDAMIKACRVLGAIISCDRQNASIEGVNGQPIIAAGQVIDAGNSGQVLRFVAAVSALTDISIEITGDESVRNNRPVKPLIEGLNQLGAQCCAVNNNDHAPIRIQGPIKSGAIQINGEDSQPVSGLLIACAFLKGSTVINVNNSGEKPWIGLTLDWFDRLGIAYKNENFSRYALPGHACINSFDYSVPGDFSSMAYPLVAALITHSAITLTNVKMSDAQGDKQLIQTLIDMGAEIEIDATRSMLQVKPCVALMGREIDINDYIDALPILAVVGCFAKGSTKIVNAAIARTKESDRITAIATELKKMGADIEELPDGLIIKPVQLTAADVDSHHDHRIAMSLAVAGFLAEGKTVINDVACINKSYPNFMDDMQALGGNIQ